jgi:antitoxin (DNA-binding transcriptional repressor) of toxin-antitoxin stability system
MSTIGAYEAKTRLSDLLDRAERGERIVITRNGRPSAVLQFAGSPRREDLPEVIAALLAFRKGRRLESGELCSMIEEGRL